MDTPPTAHVDDAVAPWVPGHDPIRTRIFPRCEWDGDRLPHGFHLFMSPFPRRFHPMRHLNRSLALAAVLGLPLCAQSPWALGIKFGVAPTVGTPGEQRTRGSVLAGLQGEYRVAGLGILYGELNYRNFRAYNFEATRFGVGYAPNGTVGEITQWAFDAVAGLPRADGRYDSVDLRKNLLEGMGLNLGYRLPLGQGIWSVQGGLTLSVLKSTQEVIGSLHVVQNRTAAKPTVLSTENMLVTRSKSSLRPGFFGGLRAELGANLFVESNLSFLGYSEVNYLPFSYTGKPATTEARGHMKAVLELNAGLKF